MKSFDSKKAPARAIENDEALLDAEEAAAIDAHDLSDPGIEGAAMERAVIMATDFAGLRVDTREEPERRPSFLGKIRLLFHHDDGEEKGDIDVHQVTEAEAIYAHDLSNAAAVEHANEIVAEDTKDEEADEEYLLEAEEAAAEYAHNLFNAAAAENATKNAEIDVESSVPPSKDNEAHIPTVEEHYKSVEKDIKTIQRLIKEADMFDRSDSHSLERTFLDDDAADLALMMMEKSVLAATDKLELCQKRAEDTEMEVRTALEAKYSAKALSESIGRDRRAAEMRFLATEHYEDNFEVMERRRDASILHANDLLLSDALERENDAELELEEAIEHDIAAKKELEQMIHNKAALKQQFRDLEQIIHKRTLSLWEKENTKKLKPGKTKKEHHFDWWHRRW